MAAGALLFGGTLLPTHVNRFAHGLAGRVEPLHERRVDLDVGLQLGPRQPHVGQRRRRLVRIGRRHQRFGAMQQTDRTLAIVGAHRRRRFVMRRLRGLFELTKLHARPARRHLVAAALRDRRQRLGAVDAIERRHRDIGVLGLDARR